MDFLKMMKQAKQMQQQMGDLQAAVNELSVEGTAGAGLVVVTLNGKGEMTGLKIDPSLVKPEDAEVLEDLILAAHNDAKAKGEALVQEKTQEMMSDLGLPAGMKLPF
ncbi:MULTISPECIES: YbaB/EbfC family nucleoid-associated protein [Pseudovibrio]|uniref:YbaB/EbfC family nucleoid-associated protein n=1 Tax=Stappiaceae TaxID=2821832 RepID=UPI002365FCF9|nr:MULTISPECIES: YbaB/EbfC family nucleoid-associated protein [Pseudovibrio]MDD7909728.1 YbaB/EbfC family nucleoid-associated protein [Pseudovibrio exalbescens]MDX5592070.1 YbaB/EbfC family nucleoid-associated protein [Pseudovibrio sp. SPO723]